MFYRIFFFFFLRKLERMLIKSRKKKSAHNQHRLYFRSPKSLIFTVNASATALQYTWYARIHADILESVKSFRVFSRSPGMTVAGAKLPVYLSVDRKGTRGSPHPAGRCVSPPCVHACYAYIAYPVTNDDNHDHDHDHVRYGMVVIPHCIGVKVYTYGDIFTNTS